MTPSTLTEDEMAVEPRAPTLDEIKANLLAVRSDTNFNIGSPAAIDHLLISIVLVIDAIEKRCLPHTTLENSHDVDGSRK